MDGDVHLAMFDGEVFFFNVEGSKGHTYQVHVCGPTWEYLCSCPSFEYFHGAHGRPCRIDLAVTRCRHATMVFHYIRRNM